MIFLNLSDFTSLNKTTSSDTFDNQSETYDTISY